MPSLRSVTALAALCSSTLASPVALESLQKRDFFSFNQVLRGTYRKNGPIQMAKVYNKYKGTAPSDVQSAAAAVVTGTVAATPEDEYDSLYLCPVTVGGTELQLDFDTVCMPSRCGEDARLTCGGRVLLICEYHNFPKQHGHNPPITSSPVFSPVSQTPAHHVHARPGSRPRVTVLADPCRVHARGRGSGLAPAPPSDVSTAPARLDRLVLA